MKKWLVEISCGPQMTGSYVAFSEKDPINDISLDEVIDDLYNNYGVFKFPQIEKRGQEFGEIAIKIWKI